MLYQRLYGCLTDKIYFLLLTTLHLFDSVASSASLYIEVEKYLSSGKEPEGKGRRDMVTIFTYIFVLTIMFALLVAAVFVHLSFGFHRVVKPRRNGMVARRPSPVAPLHLHDVIFSRADI